jgi:hypothetical protein
MSLDSSYSSLTQCYKLSAEGEAVWIRYLALIVDLDIYRLFFVNAELFKILRLLLK